MIALLLLLAFTGGCRPLDGLRKGYGSPCPASGPEARTDFEMRAPPFDLNAYYDSIRAFGGRLEVVEAGRIDTGGVAYPIYLVSRRGRSAEHRGLVVAGVHGNEIAGLVAIPPLLERLAAAPTSYERWDVHVLVPANPVGVVHRSRYNDAGCDINRDFRRLRTRETQLLRTLVNDLRPDVILSLHEGPQDGFMVITTAAGSRELGGGIARAVAASGVPMALRHYGGGRLAVPGLWVEGPFVTGVKRLFGIDTLGSFGNTLGVGVYTTESDWKSDDFASRVRGHVIAVEHVLEDGLPPY